MSRKVNDTEKRNLGFWERPCSHCGSVEQLRAVGLCSRCYMYQRDNKKPRPRRLWKPKKCECIKLDPALEGNRDAKHVRRIYLITGGEMQTNAVLSLCDYCVAIFDEQESEAARYGSHAIFD